MSTNPETLARRCSDILEGAGRGIGWVGDVRRTAERLDRDADGLVERLRKARNQARRLGAAAGRPVSVGFFGLSQAGKSYLISALASGSNGQLETQLDQTRLNFIDHVNPPGGGKEATGFVTRFSRTRQPTPAGWPVELKLLTEADLIKVLGNTFFCDFDERKVRFETEPDAIRAHLKALEGRRQAGTVPGLTEDDVLDIRDYFAKRFPVKMEPLLGDFWPTAIGLAPYLGPDDRALLFAPLMGRVPDLMAAYRRLRGGLEVVGHADRVYAPVSAIVQGQPGSLSQAHNILNVDILFRMGTDDSDLVEVRPAGPEGPGAPRGLPRSMLAALAQEMNFVLADEPVQQELEGVDLLDFPGYRPRLKVESLEDAKSKLQSRDALGELILRGKVAYLFERYTEDQEMNVLVFCTPSDEQVNVTEVAEALTGWIHATQGETPALRAARKPGLVWCVTKFDKRLSGELGKTEDLLRIGWENLIVQVLLERFEGEGWVNEWAPGRPFDNLFLVRKPGMAGAFIETGADRREVGLLASQRQTLSAIRRTLLESPRASRHIRDTEQAWEAMLRENDGGMSRLAGYLREVARPEVKLSRIAELVDQVEHELVHAHLGRYHRADGADAVARKRQRADAVLGALGEQATFFGEVLRLLQPNAEHLRAIYVRADEEQEAAGAPPPRRGLVVLPGSGGGGAKPPSASRAVRFARAAIAAWLKQLRALPDNTDLHAYSGLSAGTLEIMVDEVVTGALRDRLEQRLVAALEGAEAQASATRGRLADQQVRVACMVLNEFVNWLGQARAGGGPAGFAPPPPVAGLPVLDDDTQAFTGRYIVAWFDAFRDMAINNAGHAAGSEITPEQNERLGAILLTIAGGDAAKLRTVGA